VDEIGHGSQRGPRLKLSSLPGLSSLSSVWSLPAELRVVWFGADGDAPQKSMRMTARRTLGLLTSVKPASANTWTAPTCSSPQVISLPGWVRMA
jgi:hypothetical protein